MHGSQIMTVFTRHLKYIIQHVCDVVSSTNKIYFYDLHLDYNNILFTVKKVYITRVMYHNK